MKQKLTLYVLAVLGCVPALASAVAPTINSVSGTVQTGQTLTLTGSNMVNQVSTNSDPWWTAQRSSFEGTSPSSDGYLPANCNSYDTTVKLMGNKSLKSVFTGASGPWPSVGGCSFGYTPPTITGGDLYLRAYFRWNVTGGWPHTTVSAPGSYEMKFMWFGGKDHYFFLNFDLDGSGNPPDRFKIYSDQFSGGSWVNSSTIPGGAIQNNKWYLIELRFRKNEASGPYPVQLWIDKQLVLNTTGSGGIAYTSNFWEFNTNWWDTSSSFNWQQWTDGFVFSSNPIGPASLIEIGNSPTYASAAKVYQSPLFLSDGSVQVTANLAGLGAGPYYLWVTNINGERSAPYDVTSGTSVPPQGTALAPPSNLHVTQ